MKVTSTGIVNGVIEDKYGKRGTQFNEGGRLGSDCGNAAPGCDL